MSCYFCVVVFVQLGTAWFLIEGITEHACVVALNETQKSEQRSGKRYSAFRDVPKSTCLLVITRSHPEMATCLC